MRKRMPASTKSNPMIVRLNIRPSLALPAEACALEMLPRVKSKKK